MTRGTAGRIVWVAVLDGAKALLFEDRGFADAPDLHLIDKYEYETASNTELRRDAPGRMHDPGPSQKSAVEETDRQDLTEQRFVINFAGMLNALALKNEYDRLVLMAPPRAMGHLRDALHEETGRRIARIVTGDYVNHPTDRLEAVLKREFALPAEAAQ